MDEITKFLAVFPAWPFVALIIVVLYHQALRSLLENAQYLLYLFKKLKLGPFEVEFADTNFGKITVQAAEPTRLNVNNFTFENRARSFQLSYPAATKVEGLQLNSETDKDKVDDVMAKIGMPNQNTYVLVSWINLMCLCHGLTKNPARFLLQISMLRLYQSEMPV